MEETKFKRVGDVAEVGTGKSNRQDAQEFGLYPFFIRSKEILKIDTFEFDEEAIIIPGEGGIGDIFHYVKGKYALHQRAYRIHFIKNGINTRYAYYFLQSALKKYIYTKVVCATVDSIRKPMLDDFEIPLPPLAEQERIASALTAADNLIASLDKQIAKTRNLKQATMQHLLSSLPNHSPLKPLGEVAEIIRGVRVVTSNLIPNGKYPVVSGGTGYMGYLNNYNREPNTITIAQYGTAGYVNWQEQKFWANDVCFCVKPDIKLIENKYLYYTLANLQEYLYSISNRDATPYSIDRNKILETRIPVPPIEEQKRIASILTAMDNQIVVLEAKRSKYEMVKQGMMQQLLTGTIRLI